MKELTVDAIVENISAVTDFMDEFLEEIDCPIKARMQIDIAIDEVFSNISYYAYEKGVGKATVRAELQENPRAVCITFIDNGVPYNPLEREEPNTTSSVEERKIGGLGIYMVRKSMDEMSYCHLDNENRLTIKKYF